MRVFLLLGFLFLNSSLITAQPNLELSSIFSDNMVLQREQPIRIWGWTDADEEISANLAGVVATTKPDDNGKWMLEFSPMNAGGPYSMTIKSGDEMEILSDIYIGDVWLCSGQSNMEWPVRLSGNPDNEIANSDHPLIRHIKIQRSWNINPQEKVVSENWEVASPETTGDFTAVGYYFARELRENVDVPIGLINSSWGGSRIEPWIRKEIVEAYYPKGVEFYLDSLDKENEKVVEEMMALIGQIPEKEEFQKAMSPNYDDASWITQELPGIWENQGFPNLDGIVWLRKEIELSSDEASSGIRLSLSKIDDSDSTYVNGYLVGSMRDSYNINRYYDVPAEYLNEGLNTIMIQVEDVTYGGGLYGEPDSLYYSTASGKLSLTGEWKMQVEKANEGAGPEFRPNQMPTLLYNSMIDPIIDFPIKGVLWYQGESNAAPKDAFVYRNQFKDMITDWRTIWNQGDFPFYWVQLTNFGQANDLPVETGWGMLRESQTEALSLPNTAQAVIIDIGEADDIHPKNKQDVGKRLALAARNLTYGEDDLVYSGPLYDSMEIKGNKIILSFSHIGSGLSIGRGHSELKEFAISSDGDNYVHAKAIIEGDKVVVWSDEITSPMHVRYAWKMNPDAANLFNKEGLPASPFRTDN